MTVPRPYDMDQRRMAELVNRENPLWLVMYGVGSRRYWAFPGFRVPSGTLLESADLNELVTQMRETELHYLPTSHSQ
jgi:hypothetical protein